MSSSPVKRAKRKGFFSVGDARADGILLNRCCSLHTESMGTWDSCGSYVVVVPLRLVTESQLIGWDVKFVSRHAEQTEFRKKKETIHPFIFSTSLFNVYPYVPENPTYRNDFMVWRSQISTT